MESFPEEDIIHIPEDDDDDFGGVDLYTKGFPTKGDYRNVSCCTHYKKIFFLVHFIPLSSINLTTVFFFVSEKEKRN